MIGLLTDKMKNCKHPQSDMWPDGSCPHCGWNMWCSYFETQEEVDQLKYEKELSSKDKKDLVKEYLNLERQLAEARDAKESSDKMLEWLQDQVRPIKRRLDEAKQNIYKYAEIALMEGEDEFGHSWEDFKYFVLDEQLKEQC